MLNCSRERSDRFLAGGLDLQEESQFVEHIESCLQCRRWLEESAGSAADWKSVQEVLLCTETIPGLKAQVGQSTIDPFDWQIDATPEAISRAALAFLAPSDDPAMMGRVGPYEIAGVLGRGAMGIVLKGFDRALNRNVAIKVLDPSYADHAVARQRFAREAQAMAAVSHEHVVPVYAVSEHGGIPYFVMEYVAGGSLERRIHTQGQFDVVSIVRIALQTARGLAAAHAQGLVHRDIKPGNILIDSGTDRIRVADFGLVRIANDVSCTRSGMLGGTPQYMAPEQVRGEVCDAQADLFSLGVVMYVLCTGHPPFRSESVYGVMQRIIHDAPRSIREQNPTIPEWLEEFIWRLMAKERVARFTSANETVEFLERELAYLQSPALVAQPGRPWVGKKQSLRRWYGWRWGIGVSAVAVCAVLGVSMWNRPARESPDEKSALARAESKGTDVVDASRPQPTPAAETAEFDPWESESLRTHALAEAFEKKWQASTLPLVDLWRSESSAAVRIVRMLTFEMSGTDWNPHPSPGRVENRAGNLVEGKNESP